ncbi:MAG: tetratricopeptide repeat protein, partial [Nitrospina sp.]|nr:tetratricopeptide repeat protein [Nitrospina sp.]
MRVVALLLVFLFAVLTSNVWSLDAEQWLLDGNRLSAEGKFEEAAKAYQKSIDQNPLAPVSHYNLGIAYKNLR